MHEALVHFCKCLQACCVKTFACENVVLHTFFFFSTRDSLQGVVCI